MSEQTPINSIKSTSTFTAAFTSFYNLGLILACVFIFVMGVWTFTLVGFDIILHPLMVLSTIFIVYYIWAILTRELEVSNEGIYYKEARRKVFINWADIEAVKYQYQWGQITFWINNKKMRIHTFGLDRKSLKNVYKELREQAHQRNISRR